MRPRLFLLAIAITTATLAPSAPAGAEFFAGDPIDAGPGIRALGNADVATDGTGGIAYVRSDGVADKIVVSRLAGGALRPGEVLNPADLEPSSSPTLVAYDKGGLVVAWIGNGRLVATIRPPGAQTWSEPQVLFDERAQARSVTALSVDASIYGVPYIAFTVADTVGGSNGDVRSARFDAGAWIVDPAALDVNPGDNAGTGALRPDVSASAEGSALVVWGEDSQGMSHVFARRVTRRGVASTVREVSLPSLDNRAGASADSAEAALEYDSSYGWVLWRQTFDDGGPRSRVLARRLVGSDFDPPVALDGLSFPAAEGGVDPRIDIDGRGRGFATTARDISNQTVGILLRADVFEAPTRLDAVPNLGQPGPAPAVAENGRSVLAWQQGNGPGLPNTIRGRAFISNLWEPEVELSRPELGSSMSDGLSVTADRTGNALIAFLQGDALDRKLVAGVWDRPPGRPAALNGTEWNRTLRPRIRWSSVLELWGQPSYRVTIDGVPVTTTQKTKFTPLADLTEGIHTFQLTAIDRRGQEASGSQRNLRIDRTLPTATIATTGAKRTDRDLTITATPADPPPIVIGVTPPPQGSGVASVRVDFGDGSRRETGDSKSAKVKFTVRHRYRKAGLYTITVRVLDVAGNAGVVTQTLRVAKPPKPKKPKKPKT
jgi:hypothetical protein